MLKKYTKRSESETCNTLCEENSSKILDLACTSEIVDEVDFEESTKISLNNKKEFIICLPQSQSKESVKDVVINPNLEN